MKKFAVESEGTGTRLSLGREAVRKALHLSAAVVPVLYSRGMAEAAVVNLLTGAAVVALLVEALRHKVSRVAEMFERAIGSLLRGRERETVTGATWLTLSCLAAVVLLPRPAAAATLWCATAGDPAATLAGRAYFALRSPLARNGKSAVGSAACLLTSVVGVWTLGHFSLGQATVIATAATIAERARGPFDDNLRVSAAAGVTAWLSS